MAKFYQSIYMAKFYQSVILLCSLLEIANTFGEVQLNSLAVESRFGSEVFIAALYSEQPTLSSSGLLDNNRQRRMELKVITERLSARQLNNLWMQGIAVNGSKNQLDKHADNMVKFSRLLKKPLFAGDVFTIDGFPTGLIQVTINGIVLGKINAEGFFSLLLQTWIGRVPLSSAFRNSLLQDVNPNGELFSRYQKLHPTPDRVLAIQSWLTSESPGASQEAPQEPNEPTLKPDKPSPKSSPEPPSAPKKSGRSKPSPPEKKVATAPKKQKAPTTVARLQTQTNALGPEPESDDAEMLARKMAAKLSYHSQIWRRIHRFIEYPTRAQKLGQEGFLKIAVLITRNGQIKSMEFVDETDFSLLNKAVMRATQKASPFPPVPKVIEGDEFIFEMPFSFHL
ncbi:MAG: TonB family protein, partial [Exilibacterium sp.]